MGEGWTDRRREGEKETENERKKKRDKLRWEEHQREEPRGLTDRRRFCQLEHSMYSTDTTHTHTPDVHTHQTDRHTHTSTPLLQKCGYQYRGKKTEDVRRDVTTTSSHTSLWQHRKLACTAQLDLEEVKVVISLFLTHTHIHIHSHHHTKKI